MSPRETARYCFLDGVFSDDDRSDWAMRHAERVCADALREKGPDGLPFAAPIAKGNDGAVWMARRQWEPEQYEFAIGERVQQMQDDYVVVRGLQAECAERYGVTIAVPRFK
jgi:hypothetical protein